MHRIFFRRQERASLTGATQDRVFHLEQVIFQFSVCERQSGYSARFAGA